MGLAQSTDEFLVFFLHAPLGLQKNSAERRRSI